MTLTQTAVLTKQILTVGILALFLGISSFIGYKIWYQYYISHLPPKEEKPDTKFGLLPPPEFPRVAASSSNFSYSIDTVTGGLPIVGVDKGFDKLIKVYFVVKTYASLLSSEKSQNLAEKFNITVNPQILSETNYLFRDQDKSLNIDLDSGNFTYQKIATLSGEQTLEDEDRLISDFKGMLTNLGVLKPDLTNGRAKVVFIKDSGSNLAQISIWPAAVDEKPIVTEEFNKSLINATVYKSASLIENYLSLNFTYYPIDISTFAIYPLKTSDQAFNDLKSGKGVVIIEPPKPNVSITSLSLGYFLSSSYNPYLLPVFIFEGPGFAAYVAAISEEFQSPAR